MLIKERYTNDQLFKRKTQNMLFNLPTTTKINTAVL